MDSNDAITGRPDMVRILCLACSSEGFLAFKHALKNSRYSAVTASTSDQAVAICVSEIVAAAVVDAKSHSGSGMVSCKNLKGVRASLPVILLEDRVGGRESQLPEGVDAVVPISSRTDLRNKLDELIKKAETRAAGV